jgi:hypothetical protein
MRGGRMAAYEIRVKGHLNKHWSEWFDGLTITNLENGEALLTGQIVDQAALHGVLIKVRDLGLPLLAVTSVSPDSQEPVIRPVQC